MFQVGVRFWFSAWQIPELLVQCYVLFYTRVNWPVFQSERVSMYCVVIGLHFEVHLLQQYEDLLIDLINKVMPIRTPVVYLRKKLQPRC